MRRQLCVYYCSGYNADNVYESNIAQAFAVCLSRDYTKVYFRFNEIFIINVALGSESVDIDYKRITHNSKQQVHNRYNYAWNSVQCQ
jgi:hypothetical protein